MNCLEEHEIETPSEVPYAQYRVRVNMERYFSDERARCYMSVSQARPVRSLARRLRRTFCLPRPFALLSRGHLLPPDETLGLLAPDDPVDVVPMKYLLVPQRKKASERPSSTPAAVPEVPKMSSAPDDLQDIKRRALELLETHEAAPQRRRRRVRSRRRGPAKPGAGEAAEWDDPAAETQVPAAETQVPAGETQPALPPVVLRNGVASPRTARLVRPLLAPAAAPSLAPPSPAAAPSLAPPSPAAAPSHETPAPAVAQSLAPPAPVSP